MTTELAATKTLIEDLQGLVAAQESGLTTTGEFHNQLVVRLQQGFNTALGGNPIEELAAKIQFLVDSWPTPLEDGGITFPDGSFWECKK